MPPPSPSAIHLKLTALCRKAQLKEVLHILLTTLNPPEDSSTYLQLLQTCIEKDTPSEGKIVHTFILQRGFAFAPRTSFRNKLLNMYAKCGSLEDARKVFDHMEERDSVSWNVMIAVYRRHGFPQEALRLFYQMQRTGLQPNQFTFASVLPACAKMGAYEEAMDIHQSIRDRRILSDVFVSSALVDMYAKCGRMDKARELFDQMPQRNTVSWTTMIAGYAQNGFVEKALHTFKQMQVAGVKPNSSTFASILPACAQVGALEMGRLVHQNIIKSGACSDIIVGSAVVDMYAKCGSMHKASELFDEMPQRNAISWTVMIAGYAQNGSGRKALETFKQMQLAGVKPDSTTFSSILSACAKLGAFEPGMNIHQDIIGGGFLSDVAVANALIDMYAKCGRIQKSVDIFDEMPQRDVISWNAMIAGCIQNGFIEKAIETFNQMLSAGIMPDLTTFASILRACAEMEALDLGMNLHQSIIKSGFLSDVVTANTLIDMYAKCGSIHKAREVFNGMTQRDAISWNTMVAGYAQNGFFEKAWETFKQMLLADVKSDCTTFVSVLPACSKIGALQQSMNIHQFIIKSGFSSDAAVTNALIDVYAKCGNINTARELFDKMPQKDVISWNAIITGYAQNGFCSDALKLFEQMKHCGIYPDHVSFTCVLFACSHQGLVDKGCKYFNSMSDSYIIIPKTNHYVCMVDILSRAGYLEETLNFIIKMPIKPVVVVWTCFLSVCRLHKNIELGVYTASLLLELDPASAMTYVLLSNFYAEMGSWEEVHMVRRLMNDRGIKKVPGSSWIAGHSVVNAYCGDSSYPRTQEIYANL